ncbi:MAG: hypothetical protein V4850_35915 [Myxococcota bacterium]
MPLLDRALAEWRAAFERYEMLLAAATAATNSRAWSADRLDDPHPHRELGRRRPKVYAAAPEGSHHVTVRAKSGATIWEQEVVVRPPAAYEGPGAAPTRWVADTFWHADEPLRIGVTYTAFEPRLPVRVELYRFDGGRLVERKGEPDARVYADAVAALVAAIPKRVPPGGPMYAVALTYHYPDAMLPPMVAVGRVDRRARPALPNERDAAWMVRGVKQLAT